MVYIARRFRRIVSISAPIVMMLLMLSSSISTKAAPTYQTPTPQQPTKPILLTDPVPDPKQQGVQYFPATGHTLKGAFLDYWNRYGGLAQFGYPLTEEFFEPVGSDNKMYQVQYFERNRFEYHPENAGTPYEVLLGTLGRDFRTQDPPASGINGATYFKETGHNLSGKFKQYWDTHGGLFVHGFPITEPVTEKSTNGKEYLVQWFERSRFELHPENAGTPYEVLLGLLGKQLSEKKGYPSGAYPRFGNAPDFSWVAGEVWLYNEDPVCTSTYCGCTLTRIDGRRNVFMQMVRADKPSWPPKLDITREEYYNRTHPTFIFFGRKANPAEKYIGCAERPEASGYLVTSAYRNPVP